MRSNGGDQSSESVECFRSLRAVIARVKVDILERSMHDRCCSGNASEILSTRDGIALSDRNPAIESAVDLHSGWCDVVGNGRMGNAISAALRAEGVAVRGPLGRGADSKGANIVLLCVPDREIAAASAAISPGVVVGHMSASADLALLAPHERFVCHPLLSVVGGDARFRGATCAIDGNTVRAFNVAHTLASALGMRAIRIAPELRSLYHAAASSASNFVITLQAMSEQLAAQAGLDRQALIPLVRSALDNWEAVGTRGALTGPIVRGDEDTVARQRSAVEVAAPQLLPLWDAMTIATRELARSPLSEAK